MQYNLTDRKAIQYLATALLAIVFASLVLTSPTAAKSMSVSQLAITNYLAAQENSNLNDEEKIKAGISAYFTTRYEGQKLLEPQDFSTLLEGDTLEWVRKEKDKREIELYTAGLFHLNYVSYSYTLDYDSIAIKNNGATVNLKENHEVVFEAIAPESSKLANLEHTLTLHKKNGAWLIFKDEYEDELSSQFNYLTKTQIKAQVDKSYQDDMQRQGSSLDLGAKVLALPIYQPLGLNNYTYNRTAAKNYADQYWSSYNSTYGNYYLQQGLDCTDFVSQAIYQGMGYTVPPANTTGMGTYGDDTQWYFDFVSKTGSSPWVGVPQQYAFITGNTSKKGPYGQENTLCATKVGDIIQLRDGSGAWFHEAIVVNSTYPYCGSLSTYLIDAHTEKRYHYPLSNWASYYPNNMRFILILGWKGN
jgi:hypothetical protein